MFDLDDLDQSLKVPRSWLIGAGLALALAGVGVWSCTGKRSVPAVPIQADQRHDAGIGAQAKGEAHDQIAQAREPELQAARATEAGLRAEVARLRKAVAQANSPTPQGPAGPQLLPSSLDLAPLVAGQAQLIEAQDRKSALLEAQLVTRTAGENAYRTAAEEFRQEAQVLRKAAKPRVTRAAGGIWNPADQTFGAFFEQDLGRMRLGADVFQQRLPVLAGGQTKWTAQVRVGFCF